MEGIQRKDPFLNSVHEKLVKTHRVTIGTMMIRFFIQETTIPNLKQRGLKHTTSGSCSLTGTFLYPEMSPLL